MNPHQVTKEFERALCEYTGAPYAVAVNSCTMALLLAVAYHLRSPKIDSTPDPRITPGIAPSSSRLAWRRAEIEIPKRTYVSVPMSIVHAGGQPVFRDEEWVGAYRLKPLPIWDSARWLTSGMYNQTGDMDRIRRYGAVPPDAMICVSFHACKTLGDTQGGAILHDNAEADTWLRRARFDGRAEGVAPKDDRFDVLGWHCYLSPDVSARLLWQLSVLPKHNAPLPNDDYPDLSAMEIFR